MTHPWGRNPDINLDPVTPWDPDDDPPSDEPGVDLATWDEAIQMLARQEAAAVA
jgi:hypothetical protein